MRMHTRVSPAACGSHPSRYGRRTCWLIRTMPMSLRSVKESKAASMAEASVLLSTTRKFFCESGGLVTCCGRWQELHHVSRDFFLFSYRPSLPASSLVTRDARPSRGEGGRRRLLRWEGSSRLFRPAGDLLPSPMHSQVSLARAIVLFALCEDRQAARPGMGHNAQSR